MEGQIRLFQRREKFLRYQICAPLQCRREGATADLPPDDGEDSVRETPPRTARDLHPPIHPSYIPPPYRIPPQFLLQAIFSETMSLSKPFLDATARGFLRRISNLAFSKLDSQFEEILSRKFDPDPFSVRDFCCRLRCCSSLLVTLEFDLDFAMERVQTLFKILGECCPSRKSPPCPALLSILEVLIDVLLTHHNMIEHLATIYQMFDDRTSHTIPCSMGIIMECLCSHFLLSSSVINEKSQSQSQSQQLSLPVAAALLGMIPLTSAPHQVQCHIVKLVNRSLVNAVDQSGSAKECYFGILEQAAILYTTLFQKSNPSFLLGCDQCVRPSTLDLVNDHAAEVPALPEVVSSPAEYIERIGDIVAEPWRQEACEILKSFIEKSQHRDRDEVIERLDGQDVSLAGALLELMGSSLVKIVEVLRGGSDGWEQELLCGKMTWHEMLDHLSRLTICGVARGICPIWQGCVFAIMAVMNFLVFEEGNLNTARGVFRPPLVISTIPRKSSLDIALNWQKLQILYPKKEAEPERGSAFLTCVIKDEALYDWDDLADFIETKPGKDYGQWLKNRKRFNVWKRKKSFASSRERKLTFWKKLAG